MKRISNNVILVIALIFVLISIWSNIVVYKTTIAPVGYATSGVARLCVNQPPDINFTCAANGNVSIRYVCDVNVTDTQTTFFFSTNASSDLLVINSSNGLINFTPDSGDVATHSVNITVNDLAGCPNSKDSQILSLSISSVAANNPPVIDSYGPADLTPSVNEGSALSFSVTVSDVDGDSLTYSWTLDGSEASTSSTYDYHPDSNAAGTHTVIANVTDGTDYANQSWIVTVNDVSAGAPGGGGGGGGGGRIVILPQSKFEVSTELIKVLVKQEETFTYPLTITNTGEAAGTFDVSALEIDNVASISETSFELTPGESKTIELTFKGIGLLPDVYTGYLTVNLAGIKKFIKIITEIESKRVYFDSSLSIFNKNAYPGEDISAHITLFNLAGLKETAFEIYYIIMNFQGNVVFEDKENVSIETQASFVKRFLITENVPKGEYVLAVTTKYGDSVGTSSELFSVIKKPELEMPKVLTNYVMIGIMVLTIIIIWVMFILIYKQNKRLDGIQFNQPKILKGAKEKSRKEKREKRTEKKKALKKQLKKPVKKTEKKGENLALVGKKAELKVGSENDNLSAASDMAEVEKDEQAVNSAGKEL